MSVPAFVLPPVVQGAPEAVLETVSLPSGQILPTHCVSCGLHAHAQSWNIPPEWDERDIPEVQGKPWVLFVGQAPGVQEDLQRRIFVSPRSGAEFLRAFLGDLSCRWVLDQSVRCYPGRAQGAHGDTEPEPEQISLCTQNYLVRTIREVQQRNAALGFNETAIVCLGTVALRAVMGDEAPKTIAAASKGPLQVSTLPGVWVLGTYHPVNHVTERKNLVDEYLRVFQAAESLAVGQTLADVANYEVTSNPVEAIQKLRAIPAPRVNMDIEFATSEVDPEKRSIHHPKSRLLCISWSWVDPVLGPSYGNEAIRTLVIHGAALTSEVILAGVSGREVGGSNFKVDINGVWEHTRKQALAKNPNLKWRDLKRYVCDIPYHATLYDNLGEFYLRDQANMGNGLKKRAQIHFGASDWSQGVWADVRATNARIADFNRGLRSLNSQRVKDGLPPLEKRTQSADLGDIDQKKVHHYCAHDTHWGERTRHEVIDRDPPEKRADPTAMRLFLRAIHPLCRLERKGLPFSQDRADALASCHLDNARTLKLAMVRNPEVWPAVEATTEWRDMAKRATRARNPIPIQPESLLDCVSVHGDYFYEALVRATGSRDKVGLSDGARKRLRETGSSWNKGLEGLKGDKHTLRLLSNWDPDEEDPDQERRHLQRTRTQWIWYWFARARQSVDEVSKLESYKKWLVDGRIHTDYLMTRVEKGTATEEGGGGARTGRLASRNPNLQNIKKGSLIRACFVAPPGYRLVEMDYDRIEPVCIAVLSQCRSWHDIFEKRLDLYRASAAKVWHLLDPAMFESEDPDTLNRILEEQVSEARREIMKRGVLATLYRQSAAAFAEKSGISVQEAEEFQAGFRRDAPEIEAWAQEQMRKVRDGETITTLFGRRMNFTLTGVEHLDEESQRQGVNFPVQSLASDVTLWKLADLFEWIDREDLEGTLDPINVVHDAVWMEVQEERVQDLAPQVQRIMQDMSTLPFAFTIPLRTSVKVGEDLLTLRKFKPAA